jgi:hypothetical protein
MQQQTAAVQVSIPGIWFALSIPYRGLPVTGGFAPC